jgi:hypothetical protein
MIDPIIFGKQDHEFMADLGTALLQIKNAHGLTLVQMGRILGRTDDMVAKYIAGETEMGVLAWKHAHAAWPELFDKLAETAADREFRARQRGLDLDQSKRSVAA